MQSQRSIARVLLKSFKDVLAQETRETGARLPRSSTVRRRAFSYFREDLPADPSAQARFLRDLNQSSRHSEVIELFESGRLTHPESAMAEYVSALAQAGRLDNTALLSTIQRGYRASTGGGGATSDPSAEVASSFSQYMRRAGTQHQHQSSAALGTLAATDVATAIGTAANPLYMLQAEPSFKSQMWKSIRTLGLAFFFMAGLGALVEDKGLSRGILNSPDLRPQIEGKTKFADVKGVDEAKAELEEIVAYLKNPQRFTSLGGKLPKGVLLVGPPGTGKTMLARAIAGEAGVPFFYTSGSEFEEMFVGVGARRVRDLFAAAKKAAPCIIFIDEIDAIGGSRNPKDQQYMKMTLNQLLVELDGFKPSEGVIVVAATNFPESLDKALIRPGRFDRHVVVPNPDIEGRRQILEAHFKNTKAGKDVDLRVIAKGTPGFSGADLANLINIAALKAARDGLSFVDMAALEYAKDRIIMGAERRSAVISEKARKLTAYHEGGHALVALYTPGAHPVHKATVIPRGVALGMVTQLPETDDETSVTRRQLLAKLDVCMGGRVAEELIFGEPDITTGASSDLEQATRLARAMVTKFGMSDAVGQISLEMDRDRSGGAFGLSGETRALVDAEVKKLLSNAYDRAKKLLKSHEKELHALAAELVEKETLSGQQIKDLLSRVKGGRGEAATAVG